MAVQLTQREILCHFLYVVYRVYREVRNQDGHWSHEALGKQAKLCEMADMYDRASSGRTPEETLIPFVARTSLTLEQLLTVFRDGSWRKLYGGPRWANIVQHALWLKAAIEAGEREEASRLSQAIYGLKHNTGCLATRKGWRPERGCCVKLQT